MKIAIVVGWILLVVETLLVASMMVRPNVGDDAAGRGVARGFAFVLGPLLVVAAALFVWGQRGGPRVALWAGLAVMALPLVAVVGNRLAATIGSLDVAAGKARAGKFPDRRLTRLARAIEQNDTAAVRTMLAEGPVDFAGRSRRGRTILGRAVEHANAHGSPPEAIETVRALLAAGATPVPNVIEPEFYRGDLDAHLLVAYLFGGNSPNTVPLLDVVLAAGADPNTRNYEGQPLYFSTSITRPKLEVLAKHGADFTAPDTRADRIGWTAAMFAAQIGEWDLVLFFLDHGVRADHVAPDGTSLRTILATKKRGGENPDSLASIMRRM